MMQLRFAGADHRVRRQLGVIGGRLGLSQRFWSQLLRVTALVPMVCAACATAGEGLPSEAPTTAARPSRYAIKVVAANIEKLDPQGSSWHKREPDNLRHVLGSVASFYKPAAVAAAAVDLVLGPDRAGQAVPPSPMIEVHIGDKVIQSAPVRTTLRPKWDWSFAVDTREYTRDTPLRILIVDDDGGELLGEFPPTTVGELVDGRAPLSHAGSVHALQVVVAMLSQTPQPARYQFSVPANRATVQKLYEQPSQDSHVWHPIEVLNGDTLRISATGSVTIDYALGRLAETLGPDGEEPGMGFDPKALEGCEGARRGSVVAIVSGKCLPVGARREITMVGESGRLLLLVNDSDRLGRNTGEFDVTVDVLSPSSNAVTSAGLE